MKRIFPTEALAQKAAEWLNRVHKSFQHDVVMAPDMTFSIAIIKNGKLVGWI